MSTDDTDSPSPDSPSPDSPSPDSPSFDLQIANCQTRIAVDEARIAHSARTVLLGEQVTRAEISIAIVDDEEIHRLNKAYLDHDYATDVLTFPLGDNASRLEGEIILSAETALRLSDDYGWNAMDEMTLYVIHGVLHLVGYRDATLAEQAAMRSAEDRYLVALGIPRR